MREHGKRTNRDQLPFELLRESSNSRRGIDQFALRRAERDPTGSSRRQTPLHDEDESRLGRFVGRVKGFATKGKDAISSKYQSSKMALARKKKDDDVIELLATGHGGGSSSSSSNSNPTPSITTRPSSNGATGTSSSGSGHPYRGAGPRDPPKDIFDDI